MTLEQKIKAEAQYLGFDRSAFTTVAPPDNFSTYKTWLDQGRHASMSYLAADQAVNRRAQPSSILPGAQSILILAIRYSRPQDAPAPSHQPYGRIASYAWGLDYHLLLTQRLAALTESITRLVDRPVRSRGYTDTGPVLERDLAQRAGLGWIGKNTCLIDPHAGSYFLLAEIFLDLPLQPDPPFTPDHCGSCTRCIQACPTGCILPDRTLDAGRCISYLTIENKAEIPLDLRPKMDNWVFGCDICQQVCPWNIRFAKTHREPEFSPRQDVPFPNLIEELTLTPREFNAKFKNSPVQRPRRRGYLRNVAVALGNSRDPIAIPALADCLSSEPEPLIRVHAAWALGCFPDRRARLALEKALDSETSIAVREELLRALHRFDSR